MITFSPQNYTVQFSAYLKFKIQHLTGFIKKLEVSFGSCVEPKRLTFASVCRI